MPEEPPADHVERSPDELIPEKPGADYIYPPPPTMRRAGWAMSEAIRAVQRRIAQRLSPGYLVVAHQFGLKRGSVKSQYSLFRQGKLTLLKTREELLVVDKKHELEVSLNMYDELEALLNGSLRMMLDRAKRYQLRGKPLAYRDMGIPYVLRDMQLLTTLRTSKEKGFMAVLEKMNREKNAKAHVADIPSIVQPVDRATDAQKAREVLERKIKEREAAASPAETPAAET